MKRYTLDNTEFNEWFERDRANVRLIDKESDNDIICLWDTEVSEFVEDGFYTRSKGWHQSLVDYANQMHLMPIIEVS